jgi:glycosyltransferase involved in cell wall biosynthesis
MKVAVLEFEMHSHLLLFWDELLSEMADVQHDFFVNQKIFEQIPQIPEARKNLIHLPEEIHSLHHRLKNYDLVIFNTLHRHFEWFNTVISENKILILVHNAHFYFHSSRPDWRLIGSVKNKNLLYYFLKIIFKEKIYQTKNIVNQAAGFGFLNENILREKSEIGKTEFLLPLTFNQEMRMLGNSETLKIVIPGMVSPQKKDYLLLFDTIKNLHPKEKLEFVFLGKTENQLMTKKLQNLQSDLPDSIQIKFYNYRISNELYREELRKAHFVLCPILEKTQFYLQEEQYGKTKASGNESDCIYYGKVGIFPEYYVINNWENVYYKNGKDLKNILENLTFEQYRNSHEKLKKQLGFFSKKNAEIHLQEIFKTLI